VLGAIDAALDLVSGLEQTRLKLHRRAERLRTSFAALGIDTLGSSSQIVPALVGPEERALALSAGLEQRGLLAVAIRPPTVPRGTSRIRFGLSAAHTDADLSQLIDAMSHLWSAGGSTK
jgi:8-amino-7-oxononanoate synthase